MKTEHMAVQEVFAPPGGLCSSCLDIDLLACNDSSSGLSRRSESASSSSASSAALQQAAALCRRRTRTTSRSEVKGLRLHLSLSNIDRYASTRKSKRTHTSVKFHQYNIT